LLKRGGVSNFDDPRYEKARLRGIRKYIYRMDLLERRLSYNEVTEIFVRVNSLGAKLRSSDLALGLNHRQVEELPQDLSDVPRAMSKRGVRLPSQRLGKFLIGDSIYAAF